MPVINPIIFIASRGGMPMRTNGASSHEIRGDHTQFMASWK